jgi:DisA bacterial checkpoint controller nucleotide-binding
MSYVIDHFMWAYQPHFRVSQQGTAKELFHQIDERLEPQVFLVGILDEQRIDRYPACVEPEHDFWIASEAFNATPTLAANILPTYPEAGLFQSHPLAQQLQDDILHRRSLRDAILKIIEQHHDGQPALEFFASWPQRVEGYFVTVVLGLQRDVAVQHRHLRRTKVALHEYRDFWVACSFLDAVITKYLARAEDRLQKPETGRFFEERDNEELIRAAGQRFALDIAFRADADAIEGYHGFFRTCNILSSLKYEQGSGHGRMIIARREHRAVKPLISFSGDVRLDDFRGARKMLELASRGLALHSNSQMVFGLVEYQKYTPESEDLFEVTFLDHYHWELSHHGNTLMRVRYGQPYLPRRAAYENKLKQDLPRIFRGILADDSRLLISLVQAAEEEKHGTMIVISADAAGEAQRLSAQGTIVEPTRLTPSLLANLTPIDGAVLIDPKGYCHAIGVILDGVATSVGDPSRGARYNSALRYVAASSAPCLAAVISEDGGVDLVPNLRPSIRRTLIDSALQELALAASADVIPRRRYIDTIEWLSMHRFYLLEKDCQTINELMESIEGRLAEENPTSFRLVRQSFRPHREMEEHLYYEEELSL